MTEQRTAPVSRRRLLAMIGTAAGSSAMYQAMTTLGLAAESIPAVPVPSNDRSRTSRSGSIHSEE